MVVEEEKGVGAEAEPRGGGANEKGGGESASWCLSILYIPGVICISKRWEDGEDGGRGLVEGKGGDFGSIKGRSPGRHPDALGAAHGWESG